MSVHKKLMQARLVLQATNLKKSGLNKFAGYSYFELGDFIPAVQQIFANLDLCGVVSYGKDIATLTLTDMEDGTSLEITSPMSTAALKGCHEVQNLGAVETYIRRYLWVTAMEIVEHDALDSSAKIATKDNEAKTEQKVIKHTPVPDVDLTAERQKAVDFVVSEIVTCFDEGNSIEGIGLYYAESTFLDNEERIYAWKQLAPYSKIRSEIRSNKPTKEAA